MILGKHSKKFTIHFATINTVELKNVGNAYLNLQYTLLLLILKNTKGMTKGQIDLQYTLLLLILEVWEVIPKIKGIYNTLCYY